MDIADGVCYYSALLIDLTLDCEISPANYFSYLGDQALALPGECDLYLNGIIILSTMYVGIYLVGYLFSNVHRRSY